MMHYFYLSLLGAASARRKALMSAGVNLIRINTKAIAVNEADLAAFVRDRGVSPGRGRPQGAKTDLKTAVRPYNDAK